MSAAPFRVMPLEATHERIAFTSGFEPLDTYFRQHVMQDIRRRITACFVALNQDECVAGYYTLASAGLLLSGLPEAMAKKLPRYPSVPAVRLGRLAVDQIFQGQGLGSALLADALRRALHSEIATYAMVVDAKDTSAANFYAHHGFMGLTDSPLTLFLPLATARKLL